MAKQEDFIGIRIDKSIKKELEKLAARENRSLANFLKNIIMNYLKKKGDDKG